MIFDPGPCGKSPRGGGGGTSICILGVCRARDPHFQPWISVPEHIIFTNYPKNPFRSITILLFFCGFCRSGDHHFQNFFNFNPFIASHGRLSPNAKRSAAPRVSGRSGDTHFHAQNGSSSFRSYAFSRSKRLKLVPEPHIFTLDRELVPEPLPIFHFAAAHTYQNLGWVPGGGGQIPAPSYYTALVMLVLWVVWNCFSSLTLILIRSHIYFLRL